jgi:hypothetical protein
MHECYFVFSEASILYILYVESHIGNLSFQLDASFSMHI